MDELEQNVRKIDDESLLLYALILETFKDDDTEIITRLKKHVLKKAARGESICRT